MWQNVKAFWAGGNCNTVNTNNIAYIRYSQHTETKLDGMLLGIGVHKTGCTGETRLALHVLSAS